ncbi:MAG: RluA family pseudouridine synthase [Myxococcota bacterium]|nr:RluA family pseudouridine synthase [Myxococcota bacterium]
MMEEGFWRSLTVDELSAGWRVDYYLSRRFPRYSRTQIAAYIRSAHIVSERRNLKSSSRLQVGERLKLFVPGLAPSGPPPVPPPIVFENDKLLVVNKPSGMLVHPAGAAFVWALIGLIRDLYPNDHVDLVHRLDRETSGAVIISKCKATNAQMKVALQHRQIHKVYRAIIRGVPSWDEMDLHAPIDYDTRSELRIRRCVKQGGQDSHTTFRVLSRFDELSLVECVLHTGRTHQIRVHLEHLGFPILGDKLYGQPDSVFIEYMEKGYSAELMQKLRFPRQALHAHSIDFPQPDGQRQLVHVPLWSDMMTVIEAGHVPNALMEVPKC